MIAIVILGLGLVMVATMFPVAWQRAREMSEITAQQAMIPAIESTIRGLVPVTKFGADGCDRDRPAPLGPQIECLSAAGFAGDLIFDARYRPPWVPPEAPAGRVVAFSDTRVHALHVQNVTVEDRAFVAEDPWQLERMPTLPTLRAEPDINYYTEFGPPFNLNTYHTPRIELGQRVFPPLGRRSNVDAQGVFSTSASDDVWDEQFEARRFAWAVFHRLRQPIGPNVGAVLPPTTYPVNPLPPPNFEGEASMAYDKPRLFDMYHATLRRTRPTNRYARQATTPVNALPDPYEFTTNPVVPRAEPSDEDVLLPIPWRVQIQVPNTIEAAANATGIPTEVLVPAFTGNERAASMVVQMFPVGAQFIDEVNGQVYKVTTQRVVDVDNDGQAIQAVLTLDREITVEDVDLPHLGLAPESQNTDDPRCPNCRVGVADPAELLRTVWVFPPPVESRDNAGNPYFGGPSPVVAIDVRTMTLRP